MKKSILDFVTGKMTYDDFGVEMNIDPDLWNEVQAMLTQEMMDNPSNPFWTRTNRSILEANQFSVRSAALAFGYGTLGQVRTHTLISDLVEYTYPDIQRKTPPEESAETVLEKIGMDYLGGDQVDDYIHAVIYSVEAGTAKERKQLTKELLRQAFHIVPRKIPKWAQDPQWPMGINSPMAFISQKRTGELAQYVFQDVDTREEKLIEQLY